MNHESHHHTTKHTLRTQAPASYIVDSKNGAGGVTVRSTTNDKDKAIKPQAEVADISVKEEKM